jgi:hypothetical protein
LGVAVLEKSTSAGVVPHLWGQASDLNAQTFHPQAATPVGYNSRSVAGQSRLGDVFLADDVLRCFGNEEISCLRSGWWLISPYKDNGLVLDPFILGFGVSCWGYSFF